MGQRHVVAIGEGFVFVKGEPVYVHVGDRLSADDPAVKACPAYFAAEKAAADAPVEQATAAPGEKRSTSRSTTK
jgi:hypothetical protein